MSGSVIRKQTLPPASIQVKMRPRARGWATCTEILPESPTAAESAADSTKVKIQSSMSQTEHFWVGKKMKPLTSQW